jgi:uncharacterized membrane-anchored protein YhcB (DUF1043 family)
MSSNWEIVLYLAPFAGLLVGFGLGRLTAPGAAQARRLQAELEGALKDGERVGAELAASREEQAVYRGQVSDHMVGTVDRLRDLALQYRAVYDHLAEGAQDLCPERFAAIQDPMDTDLLTEGFAGPDAAEPADPETAAERSEVDAERA